jgi:hypothetical protein
MKALIKEKFYTYAVLNDDESESYFIMLGASSLVILLLCLVIF